MFKFRLKSIGMPTGLVLILAWAWMAQGCFQKGPADTVRVGLPDEPRTLNPWLASDVNSRSILRLIYQPLYQRDPETLALVPWLAAQLPVYDAGRRTYTIRLRSARWSDGRPLTAADVAFSGRLIKAFNLPGASHWRCVEHIETPDDHTVVFYLKQPYAAFINRTLQVSILPAHCWQPIADEARKMEKPLAWLLRRENRSPVGSGPFVLKQWHRGAYLYLERNPRFFGSGAIIAGRPLGPHIQGILIKFFGTTDVAMLALRKGTIDVYQQHIQPGYLEMLEQTPHVQVMVSEKSALYYMGFNTRRQPFNDVHLRRAVALLINKDFIVERLLQRQGTQMWSIVPPINQAWYNSSLVRDGEGWTRQERIIKAFKVLAAAGYTWETPPVDAFGRIVPARGIRLPDGSPMAPFTILTPPADYDPARAISGTLIQQWLKAFGMPAAARPMAFSALIQEVKHRHRFDAFVMGYGRLSLDPDYLFSFFHSSQDKARGWNMSGYRNAVYDRLAERSRQEMDERRRRRIIFEMQRILVQDVPYVPLYRPRLIEAVRTDHFQGWVPMLDGVSNIWTFCELWPVQAESSLRLLESLQAKFRPSNGRRTNGIQ